jgi:hypothetical protein
MMGWYVGDHMTGWGWVGMTLSTVLFLALLVIGGMLLIRFARQPDRQGPPPRSAEQIDRGAVPPAAGDAAGHRHTGPLTLNRAGATTSPRARHDLDPPHGAGAGAPPPAARPRALDA